MFAGNTDDHDGDCYCTWHEHEKIHYVTRVVVFLHRMCYQKEQIVKELVIEPMIMSTTLDTPGAVNGHEDGKIVAFNLSE